MGKIVGRLSGYLQKLLFEPQSKKRAKIAILIRQYEELTDRAEVEVAEYLSKLGQGRLSEEASIRVRGLLSIMSDLERIGDLFYSMSLAIERKSDEKLWFTPEQRNNLKEMTDLLDSAFSIMIKNLNETTKPFKDVDVSEAESLEAEINAMRNNLKKDYLQALEKGTMNVKSGMVYSELFSTCEKVGDYIMSVTDALKR